MKVDMGEILSRVIRKRRLQIHGESLSLSLSPSLPLSLSSLTLPIIDPSTLPFSPSGYELERRYNPGHPVDLNATLERQGTLDFNLVKNIGNTAYIKIVICIYTSLVSVV